MRIQFIAIAALALGGCATVTRGMTDSITFTSEPPGAQVATSDGHACATTPCTLDFPRKAEFISTFTLEGYQRQEIPVKTQIAGAGAAGFAGNLLVGGVIGMGVDAVSGATLEHTPNPVFAVMQPVVATPSIVEKHPAKRKPKAAAADAPQM